MVFFVDRLPAQGIPAKKRPALAADLEFTGGRACRVAIRIAPLNQIETDKIAHEHLPSPDRFKRAPWAIYKLSKH